MVSTLVPKYAAGTKPTAYQVNDFSRFSLRGDGQEPNQKDALDLQL